MRGRWCDAVSFSCLGVIDQFVFERALFTAQITVDKSILADMPFYTEFASFQDVLDRAESISLIDKVP